MDDLDWDEFSAAVRLLKSGVSRLYFRDVINAATGHKIMPFDVNSVQILDEIDRETERRDSLLSQRDELLEDLEEFERPMHALWRPEAPICSADLNGNAREL